MLHAAQPSYSALVLEIGDFTSSVIRCVAYVGGCCHPPLADSASCVPPIPGHHPPGSMEKIKSSCGHPQDIRIILHSPFRRQIAKQKNQGAKKRDYGADEIATDLPRGSGRLGDAPLPSRRDRFAPRIELAFGDSASLRGIRGAAKRADGTSASANAAKKNAPCGR